MDERIDRNDWPKLKPSTCLININNALLLIINVNLEIISEILFNDSINPTYDLQVYDYKCLRSAIEFPLYFLLKRKTLYRKDYVTQFNVNKIFPVSLSSPLKIAEMNVARFDNRTFYFFIMRCNVLRRTIGIVMQIQYFVFSSLIKNLL